MNTLAGLESGAFRLNQPKVVFESFGDETLLVNLESGFYYSLQGCGGRVIALTQEYSATDAIVARLTHEFSGESDEIRTAVSRFIADLKAESILVPGTPPPAAVTSVDPAAKNGAPLPPFQPPAIEKFSDMQDLLLLDPIHEVDEKGWPHQPAQP